MEKRQIMTGNKTEIRKRIDDLLNLLCLQNNPEINWEKDVNINIRVSSMNFRGRMEQWVEVTGRKPDLEYIIAAFDDPEMPATDVTRSDPDKGLLVIEPQIKTPYEQILFDNEMKANKKIKKLKKKLSKMTKEISKQKE